MWTKRTLGLFVVVAAVSCGDNTESNPVTTTTATSSGSGGGGSSTGLPCDVQGVLAANCQQCHADPPRYGAPMPLVTYEHLQAAAKSDASKKVFERVKERINDPVSPMPPTGDLSDADKAILNAWLDAGAQASSGPNCGTGGSGGGGSPPIGPDALPCTPTHTFTTHAPGSQDPFHVPEQGADNLYQCFTFKSPFDGITQGTAWAPIIGDERVLHHWILYKTPTPQQDGAVMNCNMPGDATFVAGWAPGGQNFIMPDDVGLELAGPNDSFILQVHYHNVANYPDAFDSSGVALCTTPTPRMYDAGIFTLGTYLINIPAGAVNHQELGTCPAWATNLLPQPVTAIASFPHMHQLGRKFRTDILRGGPNGPIEPLVSVDKFQFDSQQNYPLEPFITVNPGDEIRTTCTYDNPTATTVGFGEKTEDEMCFNFVLIYPISLFMNNRQCGLL